MLALSLTVSMAAAVCRLRRPAGAVPMGRQSKNTYRLFLLLILIAGIALRVWDFGSIPGGVNQDGAMAAVDAKALADYGTDRFGTWLPCHLYAWGYGQMSSLMSYLIAPLVKLFGLSVVTMRIPSLLCSIAGGVFFWLFMRDVFGERAGLIAALLVAINPWHLIQSRWALDCNLLPHFFMGGLYFLNRGLTEKKRFLYISMLFFGLCMYCYGITIYTVPLFLVAVCAFVALRKALRLQNERFLQPLLRHIQIGGVVHQPTCNALKRFSVHPVLRALGRVVAVQRYAAIHAAKHRLLDCADVLHAPELG